MNDYYANYIHRKETRSWINFVLFVLGFAALLALTGCASLDQSYPTRDNSRLDPKQHHSEEPIQPESDNPIHVVDHSRFNYASADSGTGYLLGYDGETGEPIFGSRKPQADDPAP